ncbi:MAG: carboxylate--amine ligase [Actinomycetota bacterium]
MRTPVVVLKVMSGRCAALGTVRSLGRMGVPVFLVHGDRRAPAARSRYLAGRSIWDVERASDDDRTQRLLDVAERIGARPVLIPTDDVGALFVADHAERLRGSFSFPDQPPGLARTLANKHLLHDACERAGVATARMAVPASRRDVERFCDEAGLPVVAKAVDPIALGSGMRSVAILQARDEVVAYTDAAREAGVGIMLQEHIPGGPESVWMFNGYFGEESRCMFGGVGRKLRQYPPYTGMTSLGECVRNDEVEETSRRFLSGLGYRGVVDMGFRFDERDGRYKLLDVNPRIGAAFRLFVAPAGMDVARAEYLDLTGREVPASEVRAGRRWIAELHDPASSFLYWRDGRLTAGAWIRSLRGVDEKGSFARDDLRGSMASYRSDLGRAVRGLLRRPR